MTDPIEIAASAFFEASGLGRTMGWDVAPERTRRELHRRMAEAFRAVEAAGYAIALRYEEIEFDENDQSVVVNTFLVEEPALPATTLAKET